MIDEDTDLLWPAFRRSAHARLTRRTRLPHTPPPALAPSTSSTHTQSLSHAPLNEVERDNHYRLAGGANTAASYTEKMHLSSSGVQWSTCRHFSRLCVSPCMCAYLPVRDALSMRVCVYLPLRDAMSMRVCVYLPLRDAISARVCVYCIALQIPYVNFRCPGQQLGEICSQIAHCFVELFVYCQLKGVSQCSVPFSMTELTLHASTRPGMDPYLF